MKEKKEKKEKNESKEIEKPVKPSIREKYGLPKNAKVLME